jgi:hypothetical protein
MIFDSLNLERATHFATNEDDDNLGSCFICVIQNAEVTQPEFIARQRIGSQFFDDFAQTHRMIDESRKYPIFYHPLLSGGKLLELVFGYLGNCNAISHLVVRPDSNSDREIRSMRRRAVAQIG